MRCYSSNREWSTGIQLVKKFYPQIIALTKSPTAEVRKTAAWVMGQDNSLKSFIAHLLDLLKDTDPVVRRNALCNWFASVTPSGRPELRAMLQSFEVKAPSPAHDRKSIASRARQFVPALCWRASGTLQTTCRSFVRRWMADSPDLCSPKKVIKSPPIRRLPGSFPTGRRLPGCFESGWLMWGRKKIFR